MVKKNIVLLKNYFPNLNRAFDSHAFIISNLTYYLKSKYKYNCMNILSNINHKKMAKNKKCKAPQYKPNAADGIRLHFTDSEIA